MDDDDDDILPRRGDGMSTRNNNDEYEYDYIPPDSFAIVDIIAGTCCFIIVCYAIFVWIAIVSLVIYPKQPTPTVATNNNAVTNNKNNRRRRRRRSRTSINNSSNSNNNNIDNTKNIFNVYFIFLMIPDILFTSITGVAFFLRSQNDEAY